MRYIRKVAVKNLRRRPARATALVVLAALLAFAVFGGSVVMASLRSGLQSYEKRLGADIVVVPYEASTKAAFESIMLQGIPGSFYMDEQYANKVATIQGVAQTAPQFYLASASSSCCSVAVQIIGFDPEKDFTVQPWIAEKYANDLATGDIIVGSKLTVPKNQTLTFYNTDCRIVAQLSETGTGLDTAVYANMDTIKAMIENAQELGFHYFDDIDPDHAVSSVMVKVADGYNVEEVTGDINIHVRKTVAQQATGMISSIAGGLAGVSRVIRMLLVLVWLLALAVLFAAFALSVHERSKEFAILRTSGATRGMIRNMLFVEAGMVSLIGCVVGVALALLLLLPFGGLIQKRLDLPYLMPGVASLLVLAVITLLAVVLAGMLASAFAVHRMNQKETGMLLREDA